MKFLFSYPEQKIASVTNLIIEENLTLNGHVDILNGLLIIFDLLAIFRIIQNCLNGINFGKFIQVFLLYIQLTNLHSKVT